MEPVHVDIYCLNVTVKKGCNSIAIVKDSLILIKNPYFLKVFTKSNVSKGKQSDN